MLKTPWLSSAPPVGRQRGSQNCQPGVVTLHRLDPTTSLEHQTPGYGAKRTSADWGPDSGVCSHCPKHQLVMLMDHLPFQPGSRSLHPCRVLFSVTVTGPLICHIFSHKLTICGQFAALIILSWWQRWSHNDRVTFHFPWPFRQVLLYNPLTTLEETPQFCRRNWISTRCQPQGKRKISVFFF